MHPLLLAAALLTGSFDCRDCAPDEVTEQREADFKDSHVSARTHGEISFGYLGQWSNETNRALALTPSATDPALAGLISEPFLGAPFVSSIQPGATAEARFVYQGIRITAGVRMPVLNFRPSDTAQTIMLGGTPHEVMVRSVSLFDVRTGLGLELPFKHVTPYVDLLGDVQTLSTQLVVDGAPVKYSGKAFSLGGRVGLRIQVRHAFIALAAEATALGPLRVGGSAQLGFAF